MVGSRGFRIVSPENSEKLVLLIQRYPMNARTLHARFSLCLEMCAVACAHARVSQLGSTSGGTIWTKWPKTASKWQNRHFWVKTVGGGDKPIFRVVGGSPQSLPLGETLHAERFYLPYTVYAKESVVFESKHYSLSFNFFSSGNHSSLFSPPILVFLHLLLTHFFLAIGYLTKLIS